MKIIKFIVKVYSIITRIGSYIDFKKLANDFKGKNVEKRKNLRRPGDGRSDKRK